MTSLETSKATQGSVYLYTLFWVMSLFAMLTVLLQVLMHNATPVFTTAQTVKLYHAGRSAVDLFVYHWPPGEDYLVQVTEGEGYQVTITFEDPHLQAVVQATDTVQNLRFHGTIVFVDDLPWLRNLHQPLQ